MNKQQYQEYLKSEHWEKKKEDFFTNRKYRCLLCGSRMKLEVHHLTYKNLGNEKKIDLVYLCRFCHDKATFSAEKEKINEFLITNRSRNIINRDKPTYNTKEAISFRKRLQRKNRRFKYRCGINYNKKLKIKPRRKDYAGLFTWKAEEVRKTKENEMLSM